METMNARTIFQTESEFTQVKSFLTFWGGTVTRVLDENGQVIYESNESFQRRKLKYSREYA